MAPNSLWLRASLLAALLAASQGQGLPSLPSGITAPIGGETNPYASGANPYLPTDAPSEASPAADVATTPALPTSPPTAVEPAPEDPTAPVSPPLPSDTAQLPSSIPTTVAPPSPSTTTTTTVPTTTTMTTTTTDLGFVQKTANDAAFRTSDAVDESHLTVIGHHHHDGRSCFPWRGVALAGSYVVVALGLLICFSPKPAGSLAKKKESARRTRGIDLERAGAAAPAGAAASGVSVRPLQQPQQYLLQEQQLQYQLPQQQQQLQSQLLFQQQQPARVLQEPISAVQLSNPSWQYSSMPQSGV